VPVGSRDIIVGIATGYGLDDRGPIPGRDSFIIIIASYPMDVGGNFAGRKADHSPPSSAEVKNG
jgi:hypothetical protein